MQRHPHYLSASIPGQGRRPPLQVTLHAEGDELILAVATEPGRRALKHPPGRATLAQLAAMVTEQVGACTLGEWEAYEELDGAHAGWMAKVDGANAGQVTEALASP